MRKEIFIIDGISVSPSVNESDMLAMVCSKLKRAGIDAASCELNIYKKSVDARRRDDIKLVYALSVISIFVFFFLLSFASLPPAFFRTLFGQL